MKPLLDVVTKPMPADPWARHLTDLAYEVTPKGERFQPVCSCGWRGRVRVEGTDANRATDDHVASMYHKRTGRWAE